MLNIQIQKRHTFKGHTSGIFCLQSLSDREFLSAGGDGQIVKWNLENCQDGQVIARLDSTIYSILVDKEHLLIGENSRAIHLIDLVTRKVIRSVEVKSPIFDIHRDDDLYFVGTGAGELLCFDMNLNLKKRIRLSTGSLRTISSQENYLALGYSDTIIRIVNRKFKLIQELKGHTLSVFATQYHQESNILISVGRDAHIRAWDRLNDYSLVQDISAHMYAINHLALSPDNRFFATGSMDKTIKIWDAITFDLVKVIDKVRHDGHTNSVNKLLWMKFENLLVTCSDDRSIAVWGINFD